LIGLTAVAVVATLVTPKVLVLPFEGEVADEPWLVGAVAQRMPVALEWMGVPAVRDADRRGALEQLELPDVPLGLATAMRLAEALGAARIVFGEIQATNQTVTLHVRVLDVERASLSAASGVTAGMAEVGRLVDAAATEVAALAGLAPTRDAADRWPLGTARARFLLARSIGATDAESAARDLDEAARIAPDVAEVRVWLGRRLIGSGDTEAALEHLTHAVFLDPYSADAHLLLSRVHRSRDDLEAALNELRMSLWSEDRESVRIELMRMLLEMGRENEARVEAARVLEATPDNAEARELVGDAQPEVQIR